MASGYLEASTNLSPGSRLCDTSITYAATHKILDFRHYRHRIRFVALHQTKQPLLGARPNVCNPGTNPSGHQGQRGGAPRRGERPILRVREAGEHPVSYTHLTLPTSDLV